MLRHLTARDFTRQRWRNGGGFTWELATHLEGERLLWRISVAEIERSGPFSAFAGYQRTILMLEGGGFELTFDEGIPLRTTAADVPAAFDGGRKAECRLLAGPVRVLNVIVDRRRVASRVDVVCPDVIDPRCIHAHWLVAYVVRGQVAVECEGVAFTVRRGELLRMDGAPRLPLCVRALHAGSAYAAIALRARDGP